MFNLDALTLDQLRLFVAVVEHGGFAAAGRALGRSQSVVSYAISNLEDNLEVPLFDRTIKRQIQLTPQGHVLLEEAKHVLNQAQHFAAQANRLQDGQESQLTLVVDMMFPMAALVELCRRFQQVHPSVGLRVYTEALGAVSQKVLAEDGAIGVQGPDGLDQEMSLRPLAAIELRSVVASDHPLAQLNGQIDTPTMNQHTQIILTDRSDRTQQRHLSILNPPSKQWHTADLQTKRELILAGLGWGNLPHHMIAAQLADGTLTTIEIEAWQYLKWRLPLYAITARSTVIGPVTQWVLAHLSTLCQHHLKP